MLFVFELGVYLKSKCTIYNNNSVISISDIGEGDDALLCVTDLRDCCKNSQTPSGIGALGDWFYPNGSNVGTLKSYPDRRIYKDRDHNVVRLHQRENVTETIGQLCCKLPDATSKLVTLCINIINNNVSFQGLMSGAEYCKQTSTSTASQQPVTSIPLTTEG